MICIYLCLFYILLDINRGLKSRSVGYEDDDDNRSSHYEDLKMNSKVRTVSDSSTIHQGQKKRYIDSFSSGSGLTELNLNNNDSNNINNMQHHKRLSSIPIDENKEMGPESPSQFVVEPIQIMPNNNSNEVHKKKQAKNERIVSYWDYLAILIQAATTWIFYNLYTGFYNWNQEKDQFNSGQPTKQWNNRYILLVIIYIVFIWTNMGFNPFYFSFFRKLNNSIYSYKYSYSHSNNYDDINTKKGMLNIMIIQYD